MWFNCMLILLMNIIFFIFSGALYFLEQGKKVLEEKKRANIVTPEEEKGVLEKLLEIDEKVALVMTMDSIIAGVDTTSTTFFQLLFNLANNPEKQTILRQEILSILPKKDSELTAETMNSLPYLRACMKESQRYSPIFGNARSAGRDMVLQGYQMPKLVSYALVSKIGVLMDFILFRPTSLWLTICSSGTTHSMKEVQNLFQNDICEAAKTQTLVVPEEMRHIPLLTYPSVRFCDSNYY